MTKSNTHHSERKIFQLAFSQQEILQVEAHQVPKYQHRQHHPTDQLNVKADRKMK
jgi:hypothetical protein